MKRALNYDTSHLTRFLFVPTALSQTLHFGAFALGCKPGPGLSFISPAKTKLYVAI